MRGTRRWLLCLALVFLGALASAQEPERLKINSSSFVLIGSTVRYKNLTVSLPGKFLMTADNGMLDEKTGTITLNGNIKIDYFSSQGTIEITAKELVYDRRNQSGLCTDVTAQFADDMYFVGATVEILNGGEQFIMEDGHLTACNQANPQWSIVIKRGTVQREGYALLRGARFQIKEVPVLYFPYFIAPAMQKRRSGLLVPDTGRTQRNGVFFSQPFYWAPRADMDFTFTPYVYRDAGLRLDVEARYTPTVQTSGILQASLFDDHVLKDQIAEGKPPLEDGKPLDDKRFRANWRHVQKLAGGRLRVDVDAGSDFSVDRDYLQDASSTRIRDYYYRANWVKYSGANLVAIHANRLERILAFDEDNLSTEPVQVISRLPDVRWFQPNYHLGGGFFIRNYASATMFDVEDLGLVTGPNGDAPTPLTDRISRVGVEGEISRAQNWGPYLHSRWGTRYQGAYYQLEDQERSGRRGSMYAFMETLGPRVQRTYRMGEHRLVHYMDLGLTTKLGSEDEEPFLESILFDELDIRIDEPADGARTTWRLSSRLFSGPKGKVRPLLDFDISQDLGFDNSTNQPIQARFRMLNFKGFYGHGIFEYDPEASVLKTSSVYGSVDRGTWTGYSGYVNRHATSESLIAISQWNFLSVRSRFKLAVDYDIDQQTVKSQEFLYGYQGQCVGLALNYVKSPFDSGSLTGRDFYQVRINLRNLSEFGTKF